MESGAGRTAIVRSEEICGSNVSSSPVLYDAPTARRAAALNDSIHDVLIASATRTSDHLRRNWPKLSAATLSPLAYAIPLLLGILIFSAMGTATGMAILSVVVVLPTCFRLWIASIDLRSCTHSFDLPDEELPEYSVIAPLRGEARVVGQLLSAIERLAYPRAKLDVILAVEADDTKTRAAITARKHRIRLTVVPVPPTQPATKPKALNVALELARGEFTVIYDAEDRPDPDQLRSALRAFHSGGRKLACVQARLCMDTGASWCARYFTAEYAGHFDIFLPRLASIGLPLPLGGSSNHFRTEILRKIGGWDPYNVTEDADLGMRLSRFGYRSDVIGSTTYEEAPADCRAWLRQRARWFKGWMQTWLVHMRQPVTLFRAVGACGFLTFQLVVGGNAIV